MSTRKAIGGSCVAILVLIISQVIAQLIGSLFYLIKLPQGICNIIAGVMYVVLAYVFIKLFTKKILKSDTSNLGMPKFKIQLKWIFVAILLPILVKITYLIFFSGEYVSSNMSSADIFKTLSAGVVFTGIAAGFVEEMIFRGVIFNLLKERWNIHIAVIIPSALFGIVHILGMKFSLGSCLLVIIAGTMVGIMFSLIALESGSVWNSGIVHALWNIIIIGGGLCIGQTPDGYSVVTYVLDSKLFAITGGEFGIESSVISLMGYTIISCIAFVMIKKKQ